MGNVIKQTPRSIAIERLLDSCRERTTGLEKTGLWVPLTANGDEKIPNQEIILAARQLAEEYFSTAKLVGPVESNGGMSFIPSDLEKFRGFLRAKQNVQTAPATASGALEVFSQTTPPPIIGR